MMERTRESERVKESTTAPIDRGTNDVLMNPKSGEHVADRHGGIWQG